MSLREYPDYRDSGVDWLGQVPTGWTVQPLRNVTDFTTGWTPPTGNADSYDGDFLWANISDLGPKHLSGTAKNLSAAAIAASNIPLSPKGSLLFSFKLTIGSVSIVGADMYTNEAIATFHASEFLSVEYAYYALPICVVRNASENIYGAPMLNARLIRSARIAIPPIVQQQQIANYLDSHTAKIDTLIGKQERLIETLTERRQAVISRSVTKGLDVNAKMKDSGQEWLGEVPASWQVSHLKRKWRVIDCKHVTAEFVDEGIPLASIRESQSKWVDLGAAKQTTEAFYEQLIEGDRKPRSRDLIFTRNATVGAVAQVPPDIDRFAVGQDVCILRSLTGVASSDYQQYLLQSWVVSSQIESLLLGSTFKRINVEQIRDFVLPVPGDIEQREIALYLDRETAQVDALSAKSRQMIAVLKERRQALISAAVTGKIDVRGLV